VRDLDPGIDEQYMFYPTRAQFDPGSIWLRKLMLETGHGSTDRNGAQRKPLASLSQLPPYYLSCHDATRKRGVT